MHHQHARRDRRTAIDYPTDATERPDKLGLMDSGGVRKSSTGQSLCFSYVIPRNRSETSMFLPSPLERPLDIDVLEGAVQSAFAENNHGFLVKNARASGIPVKSDRHIVVPARASLIQEGNYALIYRILVQKKAGGGQSFIVNVGKDVLDPCFESVNLSSLDNKSFMDARAEVTRADFQNLRFFHRVCPEFVVKPFFEKTVDTPYGKVYLFTAEDLLTYKELGSRVHINNGKFFLNAEGKPFFGEEESRLIGRKLAFIMATAFARTYAPKDNEGQLMCRTDINSGDVAFDSFRGDDPQIKFVSIKGRRPATPSEMVYYIIGPRYLDAIPLETFYGICGSNTPSSEITQGIFHGVVNALGQRGPSTAKGWLNEFLREHPQRANEQMALVKKHIQEPAKTPKIPHFTEDRFLNYWLDEFSVSTPQEIRKQGWLDALEEGLLAEPLLKGVRETLRQL